jgi:hypothetical protein
MCQIPVISRNAQCLPETLLKSSRMSQIGRRPKINSGFKSGIGSPPPTGSKIPRTSLSGGMIASSGAG